MKIMKNYKNTKNLKNDEKKTKKWMIIDIRNSKLKATELEKLGWQ